MCRSREGEPTTPLKERGPDSLKRSDAYGFSFDSCGQAAPEGANSGLSPNEAQKGNPYALLVVCFSGNVTTGLAL